MFGLPIPPFALPLIALWVIAIILAFVPTGNFLGMSHHTYTGILFLVASVAACLWLFLAVKRDSLKK